MMEENLDWLPIDVTEDFWWIFCLRSVQTLNALQPLLDKLENIGLRVVNTYLSAPYFRLILSEETGDTYYQLSNPSDDILPYLFLGTLDEQFIPPDSLEARLRADQILEYGKVCYRVLQPLYAFAENMNTYVERADVEAYRLTHICWAQFLGSDFVEAVGHDILINAPAWRNENLGDGGLLYVLAASPYLYRGPRQYWEAARQYFKQYISDTIVWSDIP
jgi:hypothetical protein